MTPELHDRIAAIFARVCELEPQQRPAALDLECGSDPALRSQVETLLARDTDPSPFLDRPITSDGLGALIPALTPGGSPAAVAPTHPERLGAYELKRVIAAGGMGIVYEATQDHPRRTVALKVMRRGLTPAAARRFHLEAEMLGRLDHPGIARVYEAGALAHPSVQDPGEEIPYFAMEYVHGLTLTDFARERCLGARERLALFARVCDAVHHAHQRAVIHRDLKPANILVTDAGDPKVLDFGVARAADADPHGASLRTDAGELLGTIPYMSPEQADADPRTLDLRTDIYTLGVILFELLAGQRPLAHDTATIPEALRALRETPVPSLDTIDRAFRGDVATIVNKALERDRERRYQSAAELAADVRRYLANEPILARPPSALYQLGRMARRHRAAVVAAAVVAVVLVGASIMGTVLSVLASRREAAARAALAESQAVSAFLLDLFLGSPDAPTIDRFEVLRRAERRLAERPVADAVTEAKLREYVGHGYQKLGYHPQAEPHLARALELRRAMNRPDLDLIKSVHLMAMQRVEQGRVQEAAALLREALALRRALLGADHLDAMPDDELLYFISAYTPDEPEAAREDQRRHALLALGGEPARAPERAPLPLVFGDAFDRATLDAAWTVDLFGVERWTSEVGAARLAVTGIDPRPDPDRPDSPRGLVRLTRLLPDPLGDFEVRTTIHWDSGGAPEAMQAALLLLWGRGRERIAYTGFSDGWVKFDGSRNAVIGTEDAPVRARAATGHGTLPSAGDAAVTIRRVGRLVTAWWNGQELARGFSDLPLTHVGYEFVGFRYRGVDGTSRFGRVSVEHPRVFGTPASPSNP